MASAEDFPPIEPAVSRAWSFMGDVLDILGRVVKGAAPGLLVLVFLAS